MLVTAESCTGGWLGKLIVDVAGSSRYYRGGWITYSNGLKEACLGVAPESLTKDGPGAVSAETAEAMVRGAISRANEIREESNNQDRPHYGLAITGVAGPGGGSPDKPVGLVYIGLGQPTESGVDVTVRRFEFAGDRAAIRYRTALTALQMLRFGLFDLTQNDPMLWEKGSPDKGRDE